MTKLKLSLRSLARFGLLLNLCLSLCCLASCTSSTTPTYLKENIDTAVEDICKNEYKTAVKAKLVGSTLWVYLPLENIVEKADKPEKYVEKFVVEHNNDEFKNGALRLEYLIKAIPEREKFQEVRYDKAASEKIHNVWKALRRVIFSMERTEKPEPRFFCLIIADIKNGFLIKEMFYCIDLKKVSYDFISYTEFQHRMPQDTEIAPKIIGDKEGWGLEYKDISMGEFISKQIQHRIGLKFQKPEVDKNVDIDKEVLKAVVYTLRTYDFRDFSSAELNNLFTNNRITLNRAALLAKPTD